MSDEEMENYEDIEELERQRAELQRLLDGADSEESSDEEWEDSPNEGKSPSTPNNNHTFDEPMVKVPRLDQDAMDLEQSFDNSNGQSPSDSPSRCPFSKEAADNDNHNHIKDDLDSDSSDSVEDILDNIDKEDVRVRYKRFVEYKGSDQGLPLPTGWIEIPHNSGVSIYLHKESRVVCLSRPYFLGPASVRRHSVPISAIPCLLQQRAQEERAKTTHDDNPLLKEIRAPAARVQTTEDIKQQRLTPDELYEYAKEKLKVKQIQVVRTKTAEGFRKQRKKRVEILDAGVRLITVPGKDLTNPKKGAFMLNPVGKTSVSILNEYVQKVIRGTVKYIWGETRSAITPYSSTAYIKLTPKSTFPQGTTIQEKMAFMQQGKEALQDEYEIGSGVGLSKKAAKLEAAKTALQVLIPGIQIDKEGIVRVDSDQKESMALFDLLPLDDIRVTDLALKAGQQTPYAILQEALQRNAAWGDTELHKDFTKIAHQKHKYTLSVGRHTVTVDCTNKRDGQMMAAQKLLGLLHPKVPTWGALIRLYAASSQAHAEAVQSRKEVVRLQTNPNRTCYTPNAAVLRKLREEMARAEGRVADAARRPAGLLDSLPPLTGASSETGACMATIDL